MLSYRHGFHAGNFADVLKHTVVAKILAHMVRKDKPFDYIDTHAGAGVYDLHSAEASKNAEHNDGYARLDPHDWPGLSDYFASVDAVNPGSTLKFYPGSPLIAQHFLREHDCAWLFELHPQDFATLSANVRERRKTRARRDDGLKGLLGVVPPVSRRAFVLIDPSYELRREFGLVFDAVRAAVEKFPTGVYAIWYPVVDRQKVRRFQRQFVTSGMRNIQCYELGIEPDSVERGMTSSGVIVINPPWTLERDMRELLPRLARALGGERAPFRCQTLVSENG
ncbi:MAG: 23S rRNA (adenine(2030)-N(6))-methyltransferase RlmJ [Gammaproteobacteria bacterium]